MTIKFENVKASTYQSKGLNDKPARRLFITIDNLADIPEELFAIKMSQSKNPELAGKPVFRYFSYKLDNEQPFSTQAPLNTTMQTPLAENKAKVIERMSDLPDAQFSIVVNLNGSFVNITTPEGVYTLYDDNEFPETEGKPNYYMAKDSILDVTLTEAKGKHTSYYQVELETKLSPDELFVKQGRGKVWGEDDTSTAHPASAASTSDEW